MNAVVIAGTQSGVGKTTVATGIMAALTRRGHRVQPFKVGPDYIDPSYHGGATGRPSRNLDSWLLKPAAITELFHRAMAGNDLAVVEGVMGLYDGSGGDTEDGSTAHLAKLLNLPVVLVVDAYAATRSVGATVLGFKAFDPDLNLSGVILNGIAGDFHLDLVRPSLERAGVPLLGHLPKRQDLALPERHLGLIPTAEGRLADEFYQRLASQIEDTVDLDALQLVAKQADPPPAQSPGLFPEETVPATTAIAVAMDPAFNFYYPDSLDLLRAWGAEIVPFSPLADRGLPAGVSGIYLGGGFPEFYARELSENRSMLCSLQDAASSGMPIYAECGGLMYLGRTLEDQAGDTYPMAGILPAASSIKDTRLTLGYRTVRALKDTPLMPQDATVRGHEFHLSTLTGVPPRGTAAYQVLDQDGRLEGFHLGNVVASYIHLHLASHPDLAPNMVATCARWRSHRSNK